ncbi:hypothetical protein MRB53_021424 [Persea americana]|uniref:Uncharacterized protein n=1 Tax=Persea americana TaxID=3435 RepID=A0ACC2L428_PERAE|nr:hypothetical protein MRB53_021424 [Persea americana]
MPLSQLLRGAHVSSESVATKVEEVNELGSVKDEKDQELDDSDEVFGGWDSLEVGNTGSIAERRAARCRFNAHRLNTARFICTSPLSSSAAACSPYLTIPSGLSPTAMLNSLDLSSNLQVKKMSWKSGGFFKSETCFQGAEISLDKDTDISKEAAEIKDYIETLTHVPNASILDLFQRKYAHSVIVEVGQLIFQQFGGINGIGFYASETFVSAGFGRIGRSNESLPSLLWRKNYCSIL